MAFLDDDDENSGFSARSDDEIVDEITDWLGEYQGSNASIKMFRIVNHTGQGNPWKGASILFTFAPGELSRDEVEQKLRDDYGGGTFRAKVYVNGRPVATSRAPIIIEPPPKKDQEAAQMQAVQQKDDTNMWMMMLQMQQQAAERSEKMMMGMITALAGRPSEPRESMIDLLTAAKALSGGGNSDVTQIMSALQMGITLGKETTGGSDDGGLLASLAKTALPALAQIATIRQPAIPTATSSPRHAQMQANGRAPQSEAPKALPVATDGDEMRAEVPQTRDAGIHSELQKLLTMMLKGWQKGGQPEVYAELLIDQVDDEAVLQRICDNFEQLAQNLPTDAVPWFETVRDNVLDYLKAGDQAQDDAHGIGQHGETISDNEGMGA